MNHQASGQSRVLPKICFGLVFLSVGFALLLGFDSWRSRGLITQMQVENTQKSQQISNIEAENQIGALYRSKQILEKAERNRTEWSLIAKNIMSMEAVAEDLNFTSIQASPDGQVSILGDADQMKSISILLQRLRVSDLYGGPFVPNISGKSGFYNFQLQFNYLNL